MTDATNERTGGLRALLDSAGVYEWFQRVVGARRYRDVLVREFFRPRSGMRVLDMGCGPGTMVEWLPETEYVGFDPSPKYIAAAQQRFGARGRFICAGSAEAIDMHLGTFDLVIGQGVLHHVDDVVAKQLFQLGCGVMRPSARLITVDPCYSPSQSRMARALISRDRGQHVRDAAAYELLARTTFEWVTATERTDLLRVPYSHAIVECVA